MNIFYNVVSFCIMKSLASRFCNTKLLGSIYLPPFHCDIPFSIMVEIGKKGMTSACAHINLHGDSFKNDN